MLLPTIILISVCLSLLIFIGYLFTRQKPFFNWKNLVILSVGVCCIVGILFVRGTSQIGNDLSRMISNSVPKSPMDIYSAIFKSPADSCVNIINVKDQLPYVDCCVWMEVETCPRELNRLAGSKDYIASVHHAPDSLKYMQSFMKRPLWWTPQRMGDIIYKLEYKRDEDHIQSLYFNEDSSRLYICDMAR